MKAPLQEQPTDITKTKTPTAVRNLFDAVSNNNLTLVQSILASGQIFPTDGDQNSQSPLFFSVSVDPTITRALLDFGFSPNMGNPFPLTWAVADATEYLDSLGVLLESKYGTDVNARDQFGTTALIAAASENHADAIKPLLDACADIDAQMEESVQTAIGSQKYGATALVKASMRCAPDSMKALLSYGAIANLLNSYGFSALSFAAGCISSDNSLIDSLIAASKQVINQQSTNTGMTALMQAATRGNMYAVQQLIAAGANPHLKTKVGFLGFGAKTAADFASDSGFDDVANYLRSH